VLLVLVPSPSSSVNFLVANFAFCLSGSSHHSCNPTNKFKGNEEECISLSIIMRVVSWKVNYHHPVSTQKLTDPSGISFLFQRQQMFLANRFDLK
jgi:hypothetical protein